MTIPARMLILEITESTAMDGIDTSIRVFDAWRHWCTTVH